MDQKHYLFYQKQSIGTFWKNSFPLEKFFLISFLLFSLFMAGGFVYITLRSPDPAVAAPLLASVWLFLFPGMTFFCHRAIKSYWVIFQEHTVFRHGSYGYLAQKKIISYEKAAYILTGNLPPFLTPGNTGSSDWYHKKFGNYINVLDRNKSCLFTVRYSEHVLNLLLEKCSHAQVITVE